MTEKQENIIKHLKTTHPELNTKLLTILDELSVLSNEVYHCFTEDMSKLNLTVDLQDAITLQDGLRDISDIVGKLNEVRGYIDIPRTRRKTNTQKDKNQYKGLTPKDTSDNVISDKQPIHEAPEEKSTSKDPLNTTVEKNKEPRPEPKPILKPEPKPEPNPVSTSPQTKKAEKSVRRGHTLGWDADMNAINTVSEDTGDIKAAKLAMANLSVPLARPLKPTGLKIDRQGKSEVKSFTDVTTSDTPIALIMNNSRYQVNGWNDSVSRLCEVLAGIDYTLFLNLRDNDKFMGYKLHYIVSEPLGYNYTKVSGLPAWVLKGTKSRMRKLMSQLFTKFRIDEKDVKLEVLVGESEEADKGEE